VEQSNSCVGIGDPDRGLIANSRGPDPSFVSQFFQLRKSCCILTALFLSVVVSTKLGAAAVDFWYFGFVGQPFFEVLQCVVFCVVLTLMFSFPSHVESCLAGAVLFLLLGLGAGFKWLQGFADCGCVPGVRALPGAMALIDFTVGAMFAVLATLGESRALRLVMVRMLELVSSIVGMSVMCLAALLILAALGTVGFRLRSTFTENLQIPLCELRASPVRGQGQRGDQVIVRLPIHNRGHRSAMILGATPTCGVRCLSQLPLSIAPNETVELLFQFRFPGHSANTVVWITLFTNDSKTIRKLISFAARR
jgi:hypothetical protein